jgi:hypothetical protein
MDTNNKNTLQTTGRWLRVTALTLTTVGPIINVLAARLRERAQALREASGQLDFAEQSNNLSQELVKRGGDLTQKVRQRSSKARQQLAERDGTFWTIFGFSLGLTIASIVAYLLIRRRLQQQAEENEQFLLSNNGYRSVSPQPTGSSETHPISPTASPAQAAPAPVESAVAIAEPETMKVERPANATLIGVVSTKLYYPVETPLDQLAGSQEGPLDVVYFTSEEEAKGQGFVAA